MTAKMFKIDGIWKDDGTNFYDALVYEFDDCPAWLDEDSIFYFGLSETNLEELLIEGEHSNMDFILTKYSVV